MLSTMIWLTGLSSMYSTCRARPSGSAAPRPLRVALRRGRGGQRRGLATRQLHPEGAALAGLAVHADAPPISAHQRLAQRQADAGAFHAAAVGAQPLEGLEQPRLLLLRQGPARCR
jgi:hypothetical protein